MTQHIVNILKWNGGLSSDDKVGPEASFSKGRNLDIHKKPTLLTLTPAPANNSSAIVTDLVLDMCLTKTGDMYAIGDTGNFYKRTAAGVWSMVTNVGERAGGSLIYREDNDEILIPKQTEVARYWPLSGVPTPPVIDTHKYSRSKSTDTAATASGGTASYTLTTSVSEAGIHKRSFTPDIEPLYSVKVYVIAKGTGDWTLTLHDDANNTLASSTITNANLTSGQLNEFVFTTPVRMLVKPNARTYHFHLTSTVADGTAQVSTASDLSTANYEIWANRLVTTTNGLHPASQFLQYNMYGNGRYVSVHEPLSDDPTNLEWVRHKLTFPAGYEVCGVAVWQEFFAIACERKTSAGSLEYQDGIIFFWDGLTTTYTFFIPIPEGAPYSLFSHKNYLYWLASGEWYVLPPNSQTPQKLRRMPNTNQEFTEAYQAIQMYPNMMAVRKGLLMMGFPSATTDTSIEYGVYSYGSLDRNYPPVFNYEHTLSHGLLNYSGSNNLKIGCVKNFGDEMYVSWRNDLATPSYGVDAITPYSAPAASGVYESLIFDNGNPYKQKMASQMIVTFKPLPDGVTITPKYQLERSGTWVSGDPVSSGSSVIMPINKRFREIQIGFDITATSATPELISAAFEYDDLKQEESFT